MSVDKDTLNAVITDNVNKHHATQTNMVEKLRDVFSAVPEIRQYGLLLQLMTLARSPGFSSESLLTALEYLREGQRDGIPPSEYGLRAHWAMRDEFSSDGLNALMNDRVKE